LKKRIGFQPVRIKQKKDGNQEQLRTNVPKKRTGFQPVRIKQKKDGNQEQLRTNVPKKRTGWKPIPREEPPQWLAIDASQGASTVMVLVASSCLVTLPKSTAVTASWNGPS
jgi:hypothetical protein